MFLTTHDTLLTAPGQRFFFVLVLCVFSSGLKRCWHTVIFAQCSECQRGEKFKRARRVTVTLIKCSSASTVAGLQFCSRHVPGSAFPHRHRSGSLGPPTVCRSQTSARSQVDVDEADASSPKTVADVFGCRPNCPSENSSKPSNIKVWKCWGPPNVSPPHLFAGCCRVACRCVSCTARKSPCGVQCNKAHPDLQDVCRKILEPLG